MGWSAVACVAWLVVPAGPLVVHAAKKAAVDLADGGIEVFGEAFHDEAFRSFLTSAVTNPVLSTSSPVLYYSSLGSYRSSGYGSTGQSAAGQSQVASGTSSLGATSTRYGGVPTTGSSSTSGLYSTSSSSSSSTSSSLSSSSFSSSSSTSGASSSSSFLYSPSSSFSSPTSISASSSSSTFPTSSFSSSSFRSSGSGAGSPNGPWGSPDFAASSSLLSGWKILGDASSTWILDCPAAPVDCSKQASFLQCQQECEAISGCTAINYLWHAGNCYCKACSLRGQAPPNVPYFGPGYVKAYNSKQGSFKNPSDSSSSSSSSSSSGSPFLYASSSSFSSSSSSLSPSSFSSSSSSSSSPSSNAASFPSQPSASSKEFLPGQRVVVKWKGGEEFPAFVGGKNTDGTYAVIFTDGDQDPHCPPEWITDAKEWVSNHAALFKRHGDDDDGESSSDDEDPQPTPLHPPSSGFRPQSQLQSSLSSSSSTTTTTSFASSISNSFVRPPVVGSSSNFNTPANSNNNNLANSQSSNVANSLANSLGNSNNGNDAVAGMHAILQLQQQVQELSRGQAQVYSDMKFLFEKAATVKGVEDLAAYVGYSTLPADSCWHAKSRDLNLCPSLTKNIEALSVRMQQSSSVRELSAKVRTQGETLDLLFALVQSQQSTNVLLETRLRGLEELVDKLKVLIKFQQDAIWSLDFKTGNNGITTAAFSDAKRGQNVQYFTAAPNFNPDRFAEMMTELNLADPQTSRGKVGSSADKAGEPSAAASDGVAGVIVSAEAADSRAGHRPPDGWVSVTSSYVHYVTIVYYNIQH
eukprot:g8204.t1